MEARAKAIRAKYERADPAVLNAKEIDTMSAFWREGSFQRPANGGLRLGTTNRPNIAFGS